VTDLCREHVRRYLRAPFLADEARRRRAREMAMGDGRVVSGLLTSAIRWELRDWLTGDLIAQGDGGPDALQAAMLTRLQADDLYAEIPGADSDTPGLPSSLSRMLEEWVCAPSTPDEDIAEFVGWPPSQVREHR
jgi:hypothetical protein